MSSYNKTRRAVALKYDSNNSAPVVIASGSGYIANKVVEIAEENGIPVYKDDSLSILLSQLEIGDEIPEELYKAIIEIYIYFLKFKPGSEKAEG